MKSILIASLLFITPLLNVNANILDYGVENFCQIQARYVMNKCMGESDLLKRDCYIEEMEAQDFFLKDDFIIDSDGTVECFYVDEFFAID